MATQRYNDYYISVLHTPDNSGNSSCIPFVEIRHKRGHDPEARLMLNEALARHGTRTPTVLQWASDGSMSESLKGTLCS